VIETPRKKRRRFIWPRPRRNAERLAGDWIDRTALAACWLDTSIAKTSLPRGDQLSDVSQTSSLWSFARILSEDCSKMLRVRLLTASFPGLKIKN
jgi:hypothetical protein